MPLEETSMTVRLTYPAPARCHSASEVLTVRGKKQTVFATHPWTAHEVATAKSAGMYFVNNRHDFADQDAARLAGVAARQSSRKGDRLPNQPPSSLRRWLRELSPEQLELLIKTLDKGGGA